MSLRLPICYQWWADWETDRFGGIFLGSQFEESILVQDRVILINSVFPVA